MVWVLSIWPRPTLQVARIGEITAIPNRVYTREVALKPALPPQKTRNIHSKIALNHPQILRLSLCSFLRDLNRTSRLDSQQSRQVQEFLNHCIRGHSKTLLSSDKLYPIHAIPRNHKLALDFRQVRPVLRK